MSSTTRKAPTSAARIAANRLNARLSTGPKTVEGKARSRANALKHGLTGAGIALPMEAQVEIEARFSTVQEELMPQTFLGTFFAHQIALNTVRCQRSARLEAALLTTRIQEAEAAFDQARRDEAAQLYARLYQNPAKLRAQLLSTPEGIERLIGGLQTVRADLTSPNFFWNPGQTNNLAILLGIQPEAQPQALAVALSNAILGNFAGIKPDLISHLPTDADRQLWARQALVAEIQAQMQKLIVHCESLDLDSLSRERELVADQAVIAALPQAAQIRKYESAATREIYRALREFQVVEADPTSEVIPPTAEQSEPNPPSANDFEPPLASFEPVVEPATAPVPPPTPSPIPAAKLAPTAPKTPPGRAHVRSSRPGEVLNFAVGRAPGSV